MRVLLLLRGAPGCGKTTWIEKNGLKPYSLSADDIRMLCQSPVLQVDGTTGISQSNDYFVWKTLFKLLETRMQNGSFTVIDATNSKTNEMSRYKEYAKRYRYRMYCVDFTDIPIDEVKRRNAGRDEVKRVPEEVIDKMYSRFETQQIPAGIKKINPSELDSIWMKPMDLTSYDNVHIFGDIHGCNTVLQKRLDEIGGIKDDSFYIFLGDYIDRGIENAEVIKFLMSIKDRNNVYMLEGNHERWLWMWGNDLVSRSKEFELVTKPALEAEGISKADARNLYRKLGQCAYFTYGPETYLVTHGGLSTLPENLTLTPTEQMIKGVGSYDDFEKIAETFNNTTPDLCYQIHGHRNTKQVPIVVGERVFNLEGQVEFGGDLRSIHIGRVDEKHFAVRMAYTKNTVFKNQEVRSITKSSLADTIIALRSSKYINETKFGDIPSFNFTKSAFEGNHWNEQTIKARGLYIDTGKGKVVARAYDKFFNINQTEETKLEMLQHKLKFPVTAYVKENGFLGIVSYVEGKADLFITTKSNPEGDWAKYLKNMIYRKMTDTNYKKMKDYIKKNDVSFVFECVDMTNDPHIIDYPESKLVLLDIVYNDINFKKYSYEEMCYVANQFGLQHKERACEISNWQEFYDWYHEILEESYEYNSKKIEGFVIEDSNGYMVKVKLTYYNFWKFM